MTDPVKAKLIELVPDIKPSCSCGNCDFCDEFGKDEPGEITLADVLRAIAWSNSTKQLAIGYGRNVSDLTLFKTGAGYVVWNLTTDYDNQTQEVKDFIGKLIGI